jgi:Flp pilus assembly pilin Flp
MAQNLQECWLLLGIRIYGLLRRERAQTLAEYGLIISLVAVGVVVPTMLLFRDELATAYNSAAACLDGTCAP